MREYRQGDKRLTYDTAYRSGDGSTVKVYSFNGVRGNMSSGGSAAVREWAPAGAGRVSPGVSHMSGDYAERRYGAGVSAGAGDRIRRRTEAAGERTLQGERTAAGELRRRRAVSRTPDMSNPRARREAPSVSLGAVKRAPAISKTKAAQPRIHTIPKIERKPFPIAFIFTSIMCSVLFMYMIFNIVRINEYTIDISKLKNQLSTLAAAQTELTLKLERKNDLVEIERIATEEYGMVKRDKVAKQYVNVGNGDIIEAESADNSEAEVDGLSSLMSAISINFGDIIG